MRSQRSGHIDLQGHPSNLSPFLLAPASFRYFHSSYTPSHCCDPPIQILFGFSSTFLGSLPITLTLDFLCRDRFAKKPFSGQMLVTFLSSPIHSPRFPQKVDGNWYSILQFPPVYNIILNRLPENYTAYCTFHVGFLFGLLFSPADGSNMFFQNNRSTSIGLYNVLSQMTKLFFTKIFQCFSNPYTQLSYCSTVYYFTEHYCTVFLLSAWDSMLVFLSHCFTIHEHRITLLSANSDWLSSGRQALFYVCNLSRIVPHLCKIRFSHRRTAWRPNSNAHAASYLAPPPHTQSVW
jgi:hypothetical protein